jgi:hypothetical protein
MRLNTHDISGTDSPNVRYPSDRLASIEVAARLAGDLAGLFDAALVRVWLLGPGDRCSGCPMLVSCRDRRQCFHLAASAGLTPRIDGQFARFPLAAPPMSELTRTLAPVVLQERLAESGLADASWFAAHHIASFGAWPIEIAGRCSGVIALFSRRALSAEDARALAAFARLAARALEEIERAEAAGGRPDEPPAARPTHAAVGPRSSTTADATVPGATSFLVAPAADASMPDVALSPVAASEPVPTLADTQRRAILLALQRTGGRVSGRGGAAELLGLKATTLESRMRKLGVRRPPRLDGPGT